MEVKCDFCFVLQDAFNLSPHQIWGGGGGGGGCSNVTEDNNLILSISVMSSTIMNEETSGERWGGSVCGYYALK